MANQIIDVVGIVARDALMTASGSTVRSVEYVGGIQTFASSSYYTGFVSGSGTPSVITAPPVDRTVWRFVIGS